MSSELIKDGKISAISCGANRNELGDKIEKPEDIEFDKATALTVINDNKIINVPWKNKEGEEALSLLDIEDYIKELSKSEEFQSIIIVLASEPLRGTVYEYGNFGDYWIVYGKLFGYA